MNYNNDDSEDRYSRSPYRNRSRSPDQRNRYYRDHSRSRSRSKSPRRDFNPQFRDRAGSGSYRRNRSPPRRNSGPPQMLQQVKDSSQQDRRVYVGNLAYEVKWHHLKDFMRQAGNVLFADVLLMPNGRSKGCGIVEYSTREEAENAVNTLTNQELMGRVVYVREDRESEPKFSQPNLGPPGARDGGRSERGGDFGGSRQSGGGAPGTQLFVGNLPYSTGWQDLKDLFREAGQIVRADIMTSHDGRSKGSGIVLFETAEDAHRAIERFNGHQMGGRAIEVREDRFAGPPRGGPPARVARTPFAPAPQNPPRVPSEFSDGAIGGGDPSDTIFVGNLPWSTADQDLYDLFETVGKVTKAEIQFLPDGKKAGSGVVQFETPASAEISIAKFSGYNYGRRDLELSYVRRTEPQIPNAPAAFHE
ncbi:hypothetical protein B0I72DRAFT_132452 [Yarrowia lipolytica]|uniref:YALI0E14058p n=2 Tax=Yarrowia lipolytica TaxID=4952 RepID=Q6C5Y5_YARLI|nr:YALI0E14058p [Yarrowia lipolytica CLIB122]RDW28740.1 hypothetical protein B0I71DRAFT_126937 [Yarrowia lipolytica]RDW35800.1 hypothetical protein B0I72DRAFT_132452 [Yarrowia lipolytica]RDW41634.1 hypothetical protein B0I73DRAFT_128312 [Yarrowia lipolytica]RDW47004.1 hypothetical protein B0I74DRAFT_135991 [Yarrowia lipolytica]RDW54432.1 hypothetical protein B0I75DRAFT_134694 [Yarrowia lipolytica]|eukprot:XP_503927.2 YALI0E14058p [Yarrowia lipolytica CLIB122]